MFRDWADRKTAEEAWEEMLADMTDEERTQYYADLERERRDEMAGDFFEKAFAAMRGEENEQIGC